jgi:diguanylate cyclase (GGDEF)-like protein
MPDSLIPALRRRPAAGRAVRLLALPGALALLFAANLLTGPTFAFGGLYAITVCLAAWWMGLVASLILGLVAIAGTTAINGVGGPYGGPSLEARAAGIAAAIALRTLSLLVAAALIARLRARYEAVRDQADRDPLTGLHNHRTFHDRLDEAMARAARRDETVALAFLDLDDFKAINDRLGHRAGDRVLCGFAAAARQALRSGDCIGRVGGDEFAMVIAIADEAEVGDAMRSLHARIAGNLAAAAVRLSFSMGAVHLCPAGAADTGRLIDAADRLMYQVKRGAKGGLLVAPMTANGGIVRETDRRGEVRQLAA